MNNEIDLVNIFNKYKLRNWQAEAISGAFEAFAQGDRKYSVQAAPASGKTKMACVFATVLVNMGLIDTVVVVAPSTEVRDAWCKDIFLVDGLAISAGLEPGHQQWSLWPKGFVGACTTYAGVMSLDVELRGLCSNKRTLVILDEVHHLSDAKSWGQKALHAFEHAAFVMPLSGTPFRTDGEEIPFVGFDDGLSKMDYVYNYGQSVRDGVTRAIQFTLAQGKMQWKEGQETLSHDFSEELAKKKVGHRLRTAIDPESDFAASVVNQLIFYREKYVREGHAQATGLLIAEDKDSAIKYSKLFQQQGFRAPVVVGDNPRSSEIIEAFRKSEFPFLIGVLMIGEGVDLPECRVCGFCTNKLTPMFFRQVVGRVVRRSRHYKNDWDAQMVIPADKRIVLLADEIESEIKPIIREAKTAENCGGGGRSQLLFTPLGAKTTAFHCSGVGVNFNGFYFTNAQWRDICAQAHDEQIPVSVIAQQWISKLQSAEAANDADIHQAKILSNQSPTKQRDDLRRLCSSASIRLAGLINERGGEIDIETIHRAYKQKFNGLSQTKLSNSELEVKLGSVQSLMLKVEQGLVHEVQGILKSYAESYLKSKTA